MTTQEPEQNVCPAFPHSGGRRSQTSLCWEVGPGAQRNPAYLCLMELPRSLRGICGDQRGTDNVSAGRGERRRARYTEGQRLGRAPAKPWEEEGGSPASVTTNLTCQTESKWNTGLTCVTLTEARSPEQGS